MLVAGGDLCFPVYDPAEDVMSEIFNVPVLLSVIFVMAVYWIGSMRPRPTDKEIYEYHRKQTEKRIAKDKATKP